MPHPAHFGSGKPAPLEHEKHAVKLDGIPKDPIQPVDFRAKLSAGASNPIAEG